MFDESGILISDLAEDFFEGLVEHGLVPMPIPLRPVLPLVPDDVISEVKEKLAPLEDADRISLNSMSFDETARRVNEKNERNAQNLEHGSAAQTEQTDWVTFSPRSGPSKSDEVAKKEATVVRNSFGYAKSGYECELCASVFDIHSMVSLLSCEHQACRECLTKYFVVQIREKQKVCHSVSGLHKNLWLYRL